MNIGTKRFLGWLAWALLLGNVAFAQDTWPQFRGQHASGKASGQGFPDQWNAATGENIAWKTPIPGLSHASPVVWKDKIYVITAVSSKGDHEFKHGLYGSGTASDDFSVQRWQVMAIDAKSGKILWNQTAHEGEPQSKRHIKATYANSTPATDGRLVVAMFGSEGVFAYDENGTKKWQKSLGDLNVGAYNAPEYEWGHASSPIIHDGRVYLQCDTSEKDFLLALDLETGKEIWRKDRDELPSWGTPTVVPGQPDELITNASNYIRSYNAATGAELWRLGGSSQITAPTPIYTDDLILVASGRRPVKPIFAIRRGSRGDLTLPEDRTKSDAIAWSSKGRGPYMPTPIIIDGLLYCLNNNGVFDCYDLESGEEIYRERIAHGGGGFSASPVSADGKIYLSSEDGDIFVVAAGKTFKLVATNPMEELLMATPAIANGQLIVRGQSHLFGISKR